MGSTLQNERSSLDPGFSAYKGASTMKHRKSKNQTIHLNAVRVPANYRKSVQFL